MYSLCSETKRVSEEVYDFIDNISNVQEETLTEYLFWQWRKINKRVKFIERKNLHTKKEEAETGADFEIEIWLIKGKKALPFLVQAKKIIKTTNSYCKKSLNYDCSKPKKQYELLLEEAKKHNMIPLYMFYTAKSKSETIYIASAYKVKKLAIDCMKKKKSKTITREDILSISKNIIECFCHTFKHAFDNNHSHDIPAYISQYLNDNNNQMHEEYHFRDIVIINLSKEIV